VNERVFVTQGISEWSPFTLVTAMNEYNAQNNTWIPRAPCPGLGRYGARSFALNGRGYMCCGWADQYGSTVLQDLWAYDPGTDTWAQKAPFPGGGRYTAITCATSTRGYVGLGFSPLSSDWWEYDPIADSWTQRASFPGAARQSASSFVIDDKVYVTCGAPNGDATNDLWRYDPVLDQWTQLASLPGVTRYASFSFAFEHMGFVIGGMHPNFWAMTDLLAEVWYYDPLSDAWTQGPDFPGEPRAEGGSCNTASNGYMGLGRRNFDAVPFPEGITAEFWRLGKHGTTTDVTNASAAEGLLIRCDGREIHISDGSSHGNQAIGALDVTGRAVFNGTMTGAGTLTIDASGWSAGTYLLQVNGQVLRKIMLP
jgi:N-acetylneuraminic acid mutarotase